MNLRESDLPILTSSRVLSWYRQHRGINLFRARVPYLDETASGRRLDDPELVAAGWQRHIPRNLHRVSESEVGVVRTDVARRAQQENSGSRDT